MNIIKNAILTGALVRIIYRIVTESQDPHFKKSEEAKNCKWESGGLTASNGPIGSTNNQRVDKNPPPIEVSLYCSDTGMITERIIRIIGVRRGYMQTFCFKKGQYRTFKESNILAIKLIRVTKGGTCNECA